MFYCQKCGKKNEQASQFCDFCGTLQETQTAREELKKCKRCKKEIPVASNYCYYCGMDQAKILYDELKADDRRDRSLKEQSDDAKKTPTINISDRQKLEEFIKQAQKEGLTVHVLGKNESLKPGLVPSTRLFLKDWLNVNKRMGRADFWYGLLGMFLLSLPAGILISVITQGLQMLFAVTVVASTRVLLAAYLAFFMVTLLTALIRRLHDAELPAFLAVLLVVPYCDVFALLLALAPQKRTNSKYTFEGPGKENKRHH